MQSNGKTKDLGRIERVIKGMMNHQLKHPPSIDSVSVYTLHVELRDVVFDWLSNIRGTIIDYSFVRI